MAQLRVIVYQPDTNSDSLAQRGTLHVQTVKEGQNLVDLFHNSTSYQCELQVGFPGNRGTNWIDYDAFMQFTKSI